MSKIVKGDRDDGEWIIDWPKEIADAPKAVQQEYQRLAIANFNAPKHLYTKDLIREAWNTQLKGLEIPKGSYFNLHQHIPTLDQVEAGLGAAISCKYV